MSFIPGLGYRGRDGSQVDKSDSGLITNRKKFQTGSVWPGKQDEIIQAKA